MTTLVIGASGATGRLLVRQLLDQGEEVRVVVRSLERLPSDIRSHARLYAVEASVLDLSDEQMRQLVQGCGAVACCLGHNLTFKGMFGHPRRLVTQATRRFCEAIQHNNPEFPVKFVLMNTTGNRNRDLKEKVSFAQHLIVALLRLLLPPHVDNEKAADYLRTKIGQGNRHVEWSVVRPDGLIDETDVSAFELHPSPIRSAIFDAGKTSRINVAAFMAQLIADAGKWGAWKGQMPVIYNQGY